MKVVGWARCQGLLHASVLKKDWNLFFVSSTEASSLSAWEAAVSTQADLRALDTSMCKKLRSMMGGEATTTTMEGPRSMSNEELFVSSKRGAVGAPAAIVAEAGAGPGDAIALSDGVLRLKDTRLMSTHSLCRPWCQCWNQGRWIIRGVCNAPYGALRGATPEGFAGAEIRVWGRGDAPEVSPCAFEQHEIDEETNSF